MRFTLAFDMDNAAFGDCATERTHEAGRILSNLAERVRSDDAVWIEPRAGGPLFDVNGNVVGRWAVAEAGPDVELISGALAEARDFVRAAMRAGQASPELALKLPPPYVVESQLCGAIESLGEAAAPALLGLARARGEG